MIPPQAATELTAQHLVLVAQHEQLGVLGQIRPDQDRQQAEQAPQQAVDEPQALAQADCSRGLLPNLTEMADARQVRCRTQ